MTDPKNKPWYFNIHSPFIAPYALEDDDELDLFEASDAEIEFAVPVEEPVEPHPLAKKIDLPDGSYAMECVTCHKHIQWAEGNRKDGGFECRNCRIPWG